MTAPVEPPSALLYRAADRLDEQAGAGMPAGLAFAGMLRAAAAMAEGLPEADGIAVIRAGLDAARQILGEGA